MNVKLQIKNLLTAMLVISVILIAGALTQIRGQTVSPTPNESSATNTQTTPFVTDCEKSLAEASQMLSKTLADYKLLQKAKTDVDSELTSKSSLLQKESAYNAELLKAVTLLVSSEKRDKSFFRKLVEQLGAILKTATEPNHLATIISIIVLARKL